MAYVQAELYPRFRLLGDARGEPFNLKAHYIIKELVDKGSGIFLWVQLVVRSLLRGIENGDSFQTLLKRTDEFAPSLDGLLQQMWSRQDLDHALYRQESAKLFWLMLDVRSEPDWWMTTLVGNLFLTNIPIRKSLMELLYTGKKPTIQYARSAMKEHTKWLLARSAGLIELHSSVIYFLEQGVEGALKLPMPRNFQTRLIHKSAREYLLNTDSGRKILDQDTRLPRDKWLDVIDALKATAIFSMAYKINIFNDFEWVIPSLLPENITTQGCSSFIGLLACHTAMGHISIDNELSLLNDFAEIVRAIAHPRKLQFPIFMCAAAYGIRSYLSQNCGRIFDNLPASEKNAILFSACDSLQIHVKLSKDIPADWGNVVELEECNTFAIKLMRRSIGSIKYMLLAKANADAIFSSRVNGPLRSITPFVSFLYQLFISLSDLGRQDYHPDGLLGTNIYANELKGLYLEIGECVDIFTHHSKPRGSVILDDIDYGHFCLITKPRYPDAKNIFEISVTWFVEFFRERRAFFENKPQALERPGIHDRSQYVKCIALGRKQGAGSWNRSKSSRSGETLRLEAAFEALLWNRATWMRHKDRLFPAETSDLDKKFENIRDEVFDELLSGEVYGDVEVHGVI